jgi:hypothetical protein
MMTAFIVFKPTFGVPCIADVVGSCGTQGRKEDGINFESK